MVKIPNVGRGVMVIFGILIFLIGVSIGHYVRLGDEDQELAPKERRETGYTYINPLLECEYFDSQGSGQLKFISDRFS
jgi:lipopolysaccharide export system protein LptC